MITRHLTYVFYVKPVPVVPMANHNPTLFCERERRHPHFDQHHESGPKEDYHQFQLQQHKTIHPHSSQNPFLITQLKCP